MEKMKTVKRRSEMTVNHFYNNFGWLLSNYINKCSFL
jgi:hypothetical protein